LIVGVGSLTENPYEQKRIYSSINKGKDGLPKLSHSPQPSLKSSKSSLQISKVNKGQITNNIIINSITVKDKNDISLLVKQIQSKNRNVESLKTTLSKGYSYEKAILSSESTKTLLNQTIVKRNLHKYIQPNNKIHKHKTIEIQFNKESVNAQSQINETSTVGIDSNLSNSALKLSDSHSCVIQQLTIGPCDYEEKHEFLGKYADQALRRA
jgi:hypothetical protein